MGDIELSELGTDAPVQVGAAVVTPVPLADDNAYGYLVEENGRRAFIAHDELHRWQPPPELAGIAVAVLQIGIFVRNPLTNERLLSDDHPVLLREATFDDVLEIGRRLAPERLVLTHVEEMDGLSHDDLVGIAAVDRRFEIGFDGMVIEV